MGAQGEALGVLRPEGLDELRAQSPRAARSLATSMKKFMPMPQKKLMRGAKASTSSPAATPARTYSRPSASV